MTMAAANSLNSRADEPVAQGAPLVISVPDAERLGLLSRFVKNQLEAEILIDIEARIGRAALLEPDAGPPDLVTMNSRVVLRDVDTGRRFVISVVFPSCASSRKGRISVLTPLGSILLGARAGQTLVGPILGTIITSVVEVILHQPEATGNYFG
jgi:regulator of nucleoside diphosphate kinase